MYEETLIILYFCYSKNKNLDTFISRFNQLPRLVLKWRYIMLPKN